MTDARDRRIARERLEEAAWLAEEVGIEKEDALRVVADHYEASKREKQKGGE